MGTVVSLFYENKDTDMKRLELQILRLTTSGQRKSASPTLWLVAPRLLWYRP